MPIDGVRSSWLRGIAQEQKQVSVPSGLAKEKKVERGTGWSNPVPLEPPSGVKHVDAIAKHFETLDKLETMRRIGDAIKAGGNK